jgi:hypothetical protein
MDPTFKRPPGYIDAGVVKQKSLPDEPRIEKSLDFSAFKCFCELWIGANIGEIARKWGATEIERSMFDVFDDGNYSLYTTIKAPGFEAYVGEHKDEMIYINNFTIERPGACIGGITIGADWCNKDWVRKLLGQPDDEDGDYWSWDSEFQSVSIMFENGLVKSFISQHRWAG